MVTRLMERGLCSEVVTKESILTAAQTDGAHRLIVALRMQHLSLYRAIRTRCNLYPVSFRASAGHSVMHSNAQNRMHGPNVNRQYAGHDEDPLHV